jgi:hypothetical protein
VNIDNIQDISPISFNRALDFCIWTLEVDGLHVPPFERHQGGNGTLRSRGLDADSWQAWLSTVAHAVERRFEYQLEVQQHHTETDARYEPAFHAHEQRAEERSVIQRLALLPERVGLVGRYMRDAWKADANVARVSYPEPAQLWFGPDPTKERLSELWLVYKKRDLANRRRSWKGTSLRLYLTSPAFVAFEQEIEASGKPWLPPVVVPMVNYPGPITYLIPPSVALIAARYWSPNPQEFEATVVGALEELAQERV